MRFSDYKNAALNISLCGAAGLLLFSGCGPKEEVVTVPTNETVIVKNPTPVPGKITIESKPVEVETGGTTTGAPPVRVETKTQTKTQTNATAKKPTASKAPAKAPTAVPTLPEPAETKEPTRVPTKAPVKTAKLSPIPKVATSMIVEDIKAGSGARAEPGNTVSVHYTGTLTDGTKFDSSLDRGDPFSFTLGNGQVIQGWDNGVVGMKVGGERRLIIPADMGYGERGSPPVIPPGATLVFTIELLGVQ